VAPAAATATAEAGGAEVQAGAGEWAYSFNGNESFGEFIVVFALLDLIVYNLNVVFDQINILCSLFKDVVWCY
jgi:hypothetical protein